MGKIFTIDFTKSFIDELASYLDREYLSRGQSLERLLIVFGGKRPAHFLKRELACRIKKSFIPPRFFTIDEFMAMLADCSGILKPGTDLEDRFELYRLAQKLTPELLSGRETFAKFLPWAGEILDFIGQLDLEDVSEPAIKNIQENARIGYPVPENINQLLQKVLILRKAFHSTLRVHGRTSRGLQYLSAKENVSGWDCSEFDEVVFANFFYFHRTEEAVVKGLYARNKATLVFQGDQTKWPVLERISDRFSCELKEGPKPTPTTFELKAYSALDVHSESAVVRDILSGIKDLSRTVVVLPDTNAIVPFLSTLPQEVKDFNVSMGYPLKRSSLAVLLRAMFQAQDTRKDGRYYAKDYLAVMQHPFVKNLRLGEDAAVMRILSHKLEEVLKGRLKSDVSGSAFVTLNVLSADEIVLSEAHAMLVGMGIRVSLDDLKRALSQAHELLFSAWEICATSRQFAKTLGRFLDVMSAKSFMQDYPLNVNIAARMYEIKEELEQVSFAGEAFEARELFRIFEDHLDREKVSFSGTPLKGLQVLGLLEARSLNFDHVIIMDVNEGVLPKINVHASLVPREVMNQLGLDRLELEEEIQRYQFMRVISSAKTVHLVYQKNKEKEPSRFLEELVWEKQSRAGRLEPYPTQRSGFGVSVTAKTREAQKTPKMIEFLRKFTYSASSVNAYVQNPYTFYTTYVLGLREEEDLLDEPDAALVGNFLHGLLEEAYQPFIGHKPEFNAAFEERLWRLFEKQFEETFSKRMRSDAFMVKTVMQHKLKAFLDNERERSVALEKILAVEKGFSGAIPLSMGPIPFKARIDRIDELVGGGIMVLDYKTGALDKLPPPELRLFDPKDRREVFEEVKSFQLPLYLYFVSRAYSDRPRMEAGLYSLREANIITISRKNVTIPPVNDFLVPYMRALDYVLKELLDPEKPFVDDELKKFA